MDHHKSTPSSSDKSPDPMFEGIKLADTGYKNAQDIIKFMDTKAGVVAGFALLGIGVVLQVIKEFLGFGKETQEAIVTAFKPHEIWMCVIFGSSAISMILGIVCVLCVAQCITARPPRIISRLKHTVLFPFYNPDCGMDAAKEYYTKLQTGFTPTEIAAEYENQILNVGAILYRKITWQRRAAYVFWTQLVLLALTGAIALGCAFNFMNLPKEVPAPVAAGSISNTPSLQPVHAPSSPIPSSNR